MKDLLQALEGYLENRADHGDDVAAGLHTLVVAAQAYTPPVTIDFLGRAYNEKQVESALFCARIVAEAYALANPWNGGDTSVYWEKIDMAHAASMEALSDEEKSDMVSWAKVQNAADDEQEET